MCGIVGYVGDQEASRVLIQSLKRLEYRGYDSAGIAMVVNGEDDNRIYLRKSEGYIKKLESTVEPHGSTIGISHTRWATHGVPNEVNAHPHSSCDGTLAVVHNGIVDNHHSLREELQTKGHVFLSQTDSEIIPHLIEEEYNGDLIDAVRKASGRLMGSFAFVVVHKDHPDMIVAVREKSPLVLGRGAREGFLASDVTALLKYTNSFLFMEDGEMAVVTRDSIKVEKLDGTPVEREWMRVDWSVEDGEKGGFKHYMIKEIFEQPRPLHQTITGWRSDQENLPRSLVTARMVKVIACGTSFHAGLLGKYLFEKFTGLPTSVEMASEYRYANSTQEDALVVLVTQSGETADTIAAAREARRRGMTTLSITNVLGSTITRETDHTLYLRSGPEIGVAASKTFTSQLVMMYLLASHMGYNMGRINRDTYNKVHENLRSAVRAVENILNSTDKIKEMASWFSEAQNACYLGRYIN